MEIKITYKANTDRIYEDLVNGSFQFKIGDYVTYIPNGLQFRVKNNKILRWMQESKQYVKIIRS